MSQAANIVLADGQATPVNVTFTPESVTPALSIFSDRSAGAAVGFRRLKVSNRFAGGKSTVNRASFSVEYPVITTVNGISSQAYVLRANVDLILPDQATDMERKNLYAFIKNGLTNTLIQGAMRDLDPLY